MSTDFITGLRGLQAMNAILDKQAASGQKTTWLKLKDGESVLARFANELDEDSPNYDPKRGLALIVGEHANPKDYTKKAVCSADSEGRCLGCELHQKNQGSEDYKGGWREKYRYYTNVHVTPESDDPYVAVWSQGISAKSPGFLFIRDYFIETGSISNVVFKMTRRGEGTDTSYGFFAKSTDTEPFDWSNIELFDLQKVVREVPYAEQEAFYLGFDANVGNGVATSSMDW